MNILLLEPNYKNKYPPLGLMKISTYHKNKNDNVNFFKGKLPKESEVKSWDRVYITTLFTYEWEEIIDTIEYAKKLLKSKDQIFVGGIAATLMADEIEEETGIKPIKRKLDDTNIEAKKRIGYGNNHIIDECPPDYSILDEVDYEYGSSSWNARDAYYAYMTRGCGMNCQFCAVDKIEPEYESYIPIKNQIETIEKKEGEKKDKLLLMDNNVLKSPCFDKIVEEIKQLGFEKNNSHNRTVDFNQGLDAKFLTEEKAKKLGELAIKPARIAFDHIEERDVYKEAIKKCAKYGIKHFSNYMLYNGKSFSAKGNTYEADAPEDLYTRLEVTMNLQESINENRNKEEEIRIYSFPMKFVPIGDKNRDFVGEKWNKKFLRAIQVMLLPSQGVGVVSEEFFRKAFGENLEKYKRNLKMPESILMSRGKFLKRDEELESEWIKRKNGNEEANKKYKYYEEWNELYSELNDKEKKKLLKLIEDNTFKFDKYLKINKRDLKKIYLHYLSFSQFLLLLNELVKLSRSNEIELIREYINEDFDLYIEEIAVYICSKRVVYKKLLGFICIFKEEGIKLILSKWINNDFKKEHLLERLDKAIGYVGKGFVNVKMDQLWAIKRYMDSGCLNDQEEKVVKKYIKNLNEDKINELLEDKFKDFKKQLKLNNKEAFCFKKIDQEIETVTNKLKKQLSWS
jgi:hypothetical protein